MDGYNQETVHNAIDEIVINAEQMTVSSTTTYQTNVVDVLCYAWVSETGKNRIIDICSKLDAINISFKDTCIAIIQNIEDSADIISRNMQENNFYTKKSPTINIKYYDAASAKASDANGVYVMVEYLEKAKTWISENYIARINKNWAEIETAAAQSGLYSVDNSLNQTIHKKIVDAQTKCEEWANEIVSFINATLESQVEGAINARNKGAELLEQIRWQQNAPKL